MSAPKPLSGRRVVVTRSREQASELAAKLNALGAEVVELPLIRITQEIDKQDLADVMLEFASYDWIVFTSGNGVRHFFDQFFRLYDDIRSLGLLRIACVGDTTAAAVRALQLKIECQPKTATAEDLAKALIATGSLDSAKVLVITGNLNRDTLMTMLEGGGAIVDQLRVYKTEAVDLGSEPAAARYRSDGADAVLFASSSTARSFAENSKLLQLGPKARRPLLGSIGQQTSAAMKATGMKVDFEAATPGIEPLIEALVKRLNHG